MAVLRTIKCDVPGCTAHMTEPAPNAGWSGWGALHGINLNGVDNPSLCPEHLRAAAEFIDKEIAHGMD